jgi:hypothetical protein
MGLLTLSQTTPVILSVEISSVQILYRMYDDLLFNKMATSINGCDTKLLSNQFI